MIPEFLGDGAASDEPVDALADALGSAWPGSKPEFFFQGEDERGIYFVGIDDDAKVAVVSVTNANGGWRPDGVQACTR
jgi:hypothetical protein